MNSDRKRLQTLRERVDAMLDRADGKICERDQEGYFDVMDEITLLIADTIHKGLDSADAE